MTSTLDNVTADPAPRPRVRQPSSSFRPDIQGLRAFAVIAVLLDHLFAWPAGGFLGVDVFFVVSGFLITGLLIREYERTGTISFRSFYERRIKRILPASVLVLFVTGVAACVVFPRTRAGSTLIDAVWSLFFAGNWRFATNGTDYFQEGTPPSPIQHYWSLGVEEQFYVIWPWLMLGLLALLTRTRRGSARTVLGVAMGVIILGSFVWALAETAGDPTWAYFSTFSRAWELGVGALLAVAGPLLLRIPGVLRPILTWAGLAGMVASVLWITSDGGAFPAPLAAVPVLSVALVIAAGAGPVARAPLILTNPVSRYIGDISFSLYLWHWPVIVLLVAVLPAGSPVYYLSALVLSFVLSVVSYHVIEDPLRRAPWFRRPAVPATSRRRRNPSRLRVAVAVLAVVVVVGTSTAVVTLRSDTEASQAAGVGAEQLKKECLGAGSLESSADCRALGDSLWPSIDAYATEVGGSFQCWREEGGAAFPECDLGAADGDLKVALRGDSHAASLLPALEPIAVEQGWDLDVFTGWGCHWYVHDEGDDCHGPLEQAQDRMLTGEPYDVVIVSSSRYDVVRSAQDRMERYEQAWEPVAARGTKIIVVADVPATTDEALQCMTRVGFTPQDHDCGASAQEAFGMVDPLPEVASRIDGAEVIDLSQFFCSDDFCPAVIGNAVVYRDSKAHTTATYMRTLKPALEERLLAILGG
ncbi:acyltransferase family protein [Citricoccus sp. K5]|uniref:acyltransferase family protein n=1 Tax=Citricoccus sp. K5 TaxID=2653135 RepID=UPI0012EFC54D|nr:acyltransferase family protein [Citricoccus sp. K5]VXB19381.1 Peptidoglycan/LPS O-acetylase OafA/YrhL, contains acyltransferase and SGNH-hydrolase domains [Citricoccus sp. K5]